MALQIAIGALAAIALIVVLINRRPAHFCIERSAEITASGERVFALLNDFHEWAKWSPWEKLDPAMKKTFVGPDAGKGATYSWLGNNKVGEGNMTILDSKPNEFVSLQLEFLKPFPIKNKTTFKLSLSSGGTEVRWITEGENTFSSKAFSLLVNMDKLLGKDLEQGLANLNAAAQSAS